jgi:pimeloyl-ACP methyl ester carboxylesterase
MLGGKSNGGLGGRVLARRSVAVIGALVVLLGACSVTEPDLRALYQVESRMTMDAMPGVVQPPVVIIPGVLSSTLVDEAGKERWFGSVGRLASSRYEDLALDIDPNTLLPKPSKIRPGRLPDKVLGFDFYGSLFNALEDYGDYQLTQPGTPFAGGGRRYYQFAYDWRYDNVHTAKLLDEYIEQIRRDYNDPDLKVDIIAHSMGGLVARYYMRYGGEDVLDGNEFPVTQAGAKKVRRLIQLGTPNLGTISILHSIIEGYPVLLTRVPVETIATMPSLLQMLPHPLNDWLVTNQGEVLDRDLFDAKMWQRFQWGVYDPAVAQRVLSKFDSQDEGEAYLQLLQQYFHKHLERARRFVWSLTVPVPEIGYEIIAFGGNCELTPARLLVEEIKGESVVRLWPKKVKNKVAGVDYERLMLEPGDGRVTKPSMLARELLDPTRPRHEYSYFPLDHAFFLCHGHGTLTGNINFQDNLLNALLEPPAAMRMMQ